MFIFKKNTVRSIGHNNKNYTLSYLARAAQGCSHVLSPTAWVTSPYRKKKCQLCNIENAINI